MSPIQALHSATLSAATLMGLDGELGSLEAGKRADLVVVDGDPLDVNRLSPTGSGWSIRTAGE